MSSLTISFLMTGHDPLKYENEWDGDRATQFAIRNSNVNCTQEHSSQFKIYTSYFRPEFLGCSTCGIPLPL